MYILQVYKTELVYFESGRFPFEITFKCRLLKYWCKLLNLKNTHHCKCAYIELISTCDLYRNWATDVKDLLFSLGLGYVWINQEVCDVNLFVSTVKQILQDKILYKHSEVPLIHLVKLDFTNA